MRNVYMSAAREIEAAHRRGKRQRMARHALRFGCVALKELLRGVIYVSLFFAAIHATRSEPAEQKPDPAWHGVAIDPHNRT